jgi:hypothetical protein
MMNFVIYSLVSVPALCTIPAEEVINFFPCGSRPRHAGHTHPSSLLPPPLAGLLSYLEPFPQLVNTIAVQASFEEIHVVNSVWFFFVNYISPRGTMSCDGGRPTRRPRGKIVCLLSFVHSVTRVFTWRVWGGCLVLFGPPWHYVTLYCIALIYFTIYYWYYYTLLYINTHYCRFLQFTVVLILFYLSEKNILCLFVERSSTSFCATLGN